MKKVQGNDSFQRINYLYQISKFIANRNPALSSYYGNLIVNVAKKNVLKIHPDVKRQICKKCRCILVNGVSAKMKIRNKPKAIEWTCNICSSKRTFPANKEKDHTIWLEKPEAAVEMSLHWKYVQLFGTFTRGISTISDIIAETTEAIWTMLQKECMAIPSTEKWKDISNHFYEIWNIPNCLGAMDGKHIRIQ